ncbi:phosphoribosyl-AMP cyclohydrolase [Caulobacter sp. KR2-114]|uniref:phosphoribosyl-AMP cyclohydrolase n=1 Tax=Caulobacter sp. KR2-114 TaxID=3400912 RepID=UPI003BFBC4C0
MSDALFPSLSDHDALERGAVLAPSFGADGLVAAIVQHADNGEVLMVGWMNAQALKLTLETGVTHFWSRKRQAIWKKGETSGQLLPVRELRIDCDQDAVLVKTIPGGDGGVCHVAGFRTCFYRRVEDGALAEDAGSRLA